MKGRMLNREVCISAKLDALKDDTTRLFATWTIPHLDKRGVFHATPQIARAHVFPLKDGLTVKHVAEMLDDMERVGIIRRFESGGRVWQVWPGFAHNQPNLRGERERTDYPDPMALSDVARENPATAGQLPDVRGEKLAEVQVQIEVEPNLSRSVTAAASAARTSGASSRKVSGFAVVHTEHADERVSAYMSILGQKQITETNAETIMRRVTADSIAIWRDVLTIWAIGGDRGPYNATNLAGLFERYDAEVNSRRVKSMTPAPAYTNGNGRGKPVMLPQVKDVIGADFAAAEERARKQRSDRAAQKAAMEVSR